MAKIEYNKITPKKVVVMNNDPYLVLSSNISKKDRQKASNNTKLKNLRTGNVIEKTFHQSDRLEEAEIDKKEIKYLYKHRSEYWFCQPDNPRERFKLTEDVVGDLSSYITENSIVEALVFNDKIISTIIPIKVILTVKEAPEAVKGNTTSGATKEITLETGLKIQSPQFIKTGDKVVVNTETGTYSERKTP